MYKSGKYRIFTSNLFHVVGRYNIVESDHRLLREQMVDRKSGKHGEVIIAISFKVLSSIK